MEITKENLELFAAVNYENKQCLSREEFLEDLRKANTIKRLITRYLNDEKVNIKLLVNLVVTFYNCFDHQAATKILQFKLEEKEKPYMNEILFFLYLPTITKTQRNETFATILTEGFA